MTGAEKGGKRRLYSVQLTVLVEAPNAERAMVLANMIPEEYLCATTSAGDRCGLVEWKIDTGSVAEVRP